MKKHLLYRFTSLFLVICILAASLCLPGCGKKSPPPTGQSISTEISQDNPQQETTSQNNSTTDTATGTEDSGNSDTAPTKTVKNVIFMIADGGGYDNFTLADKVKKEMTARGIKSLAGAKTEVTGDLLTGLGKSNVSGLYLNEFLVGSANTLLHNAYGNEDNFESYLTDSAAAATALATGYKTNYYYAGVDADGHPRATLSELARLNGMATGIVTTKSYIDATPLVFMTGHVIHRRQYQDGSYQALISGTDVVIGEGTEFGDMVGGKPSSHPQVSASSMGYTVARNKSQLLEKASIASTTKLWAPILGVNNSGKTLKTAEKDLTSDLISYDVQAALSAEQPSILDMTKAALQVLANNINDPDGFFLMIEGGAVDNAAESGCLRPMVGEYLAFDEAFGYCVNWAAQRGDTMVIAVPDHDSGGFSGIEKCEKQIIDGIISGFLGETPFSNGMKFKEIKGTLTKMGADTADMSIFSGHTDMPVPISLYAPDSIRNDLLKNITLPTTDGNVRTGSNEYYVKNETGSYTWYASSALNSDYVVDNTKIAPAIAKSMQLGSLDDATDILYNKIGYIEDTGEFTGEYGGNIVFDKTIHECEYSQYCHCVYRNEEVNLTVNRNTSAYILKGTTYENPKIGNMPLRSIFVQGSPVGPEDGTFYVPYNILTASGLGWCVTISGSDYPFGKVITAKTDASITLPWSPDGQSATYTDGSKTYRSGDTIAYNGADVKLTVSN